MRNIGAMAEHALSAPETLIIFIDLQEGIVNVGATADQARLRTCVGALADLALALAIPVAITSVPTTGGTVAPLLAELAARLPQTPVHVRTTAGAFENAAFRATLEQSGRRTLILAGVATEVAVALTALHAIRLGFDVRIAVDACSGLDTRSELATFTRLSAAGVLLSSVPAIAAELAGDFTTETGRAAMRALQSTLDTHGHGHAAPGGDDHDHLTHDAHDHQHGRSAKP